MKVFQLNTFCGVKSTGRIACEIAKLVASDGGECQIGYGVPGISTDSEPFAYRVGSPFERKIHAVIRKLFDAEGYGSLWATRKLVYQLKAFQPDLIHFHNLHGCYLHLPTLFRFLSKTNIPVVWTLHDCWPFTGHCAYFDYCGCEKWTFTCTHCPQQDHYPVCIGIDGSKRNHQMKKKWFLKLKNLTFVAPCQWMTKPLARSFLKNFPVKVIPNGVNLSVFQPVSNDLRERFSLQNKRICLAVAAEWDERKGLRYICEAAETLGEDYAFVVIGLEPNQQSGLPKNVLGLDRTGSTHELAAWYSAADCFINPTLEDNMPMVNLEALACGTPVVSFETGGCPEAIDPTCGVVVKQGDMNAFCHAIQLWSANKASHVNQCIHRAQTFDCSNTFRSYLALYKELCR